MPMRWLVCALLVLTLAVPLFAATPEPPPAPLPTPAITMTAERLEQLKKGGNWWYTHETESLHLVESFDAKAQTLTFKRYIFAREGDSSSEVVFTAETSPRLKSFQQIRPGRKSHATGAVEGETLSGIDCDGDAYSYPYHGELLPDGAIGLAAMAMDWKARERFSLTVLETATQDVLPPQVVQPKVETKKLAGAELSCVTVRLGDYLYSVDDAGRIVEINYAEGVGKWPLLEAPKKPPHADFVEREGPDNTLESAKLIQFLKRPPATGLYIQGANEHALKLGLHEGDFVTKYDGAIAETLPQLKGAMDNAIKNHKQNVDLEFWRRGETNKISIPTGQIGINTLTLKKDVEANLDDAMFGGMGFGPGPRPPPTKYETLAREKCGSQVPWGNDYEAALAQAKAEHKVVLWWAAPIHGASIYKLDVFADFLNVGLFTDPEIVEFVNKNFVTFKAPLTRKQKEEFKLGFLTAPAFLFIDADGKLLHYVDGLTTIQKEFFMGEFEAVARRGIASTEPATPLEEAAALAKAGKTDDGAALLAASPLDAAWLRLRSNELDKALAVFHELPVEKDAGPRVMERLYAEGVALFLQNKDSEARAIWKQAADKDPAAPWAWRAAAELENIGPLTRGFESPYWLERGVLPQSVDIAKFPHTTRGIVAETDVKVAVHTGVEYLLEHQSADGGWNDTNYDFGGIRAMPNVRTAVTAICAEALLAHRDADPARVDAALNRAWPYLIDPKHLTLDDPNEIIWAHIYRLNFFSAWLHSCSEEQKPKLLNEMKKIATMLTKEHLSKTGFYRHEYENDFVTGSVLLSLKLAKDAGVTVDDGAIAKSMDALEKLRSPRGTYPYDTEIGSGPQAWKGCAGRTINCEAALLAWGRGSAEHLRVAIEKYIQFNFVQERVRKEPFHSDAYRIGGFFYWYNQHVLSQVALMTDRDTARKAAEFMEKMVLATREADGTWVDSIELGKTYATGMALLVLDAARKTRNY